MKMSQQIINGQEFEIYDDGATRYDEAQALTYEQQAQARENIGAAAVGEGGGISSTASTLLVEILRNAVYSTDQSANITALENALLGGGEEPDIPDVPDEPVEPDVPEKTLTSISATYSGGDVTVGTAVSALTGIVVTAHYSDGSTVTVTGYTLSGNIAEGENTITVTYEGKTATLVVTGVAASDETVVPVTWTYGYKNLDGTPVETTTSCYSSPINHAGANTLTIRIKEGCTINAFCSILLSGGLLDQSSGKMLATDKYLGSNYKHEISFDVSGITNECVWITLNDSGNEKTTANVEVVLA